MKKDAFPGLLEKFKFLVTTGAFDSIEALAGKLGISRATLYGWCRGRDGIGQNTVPKDRVDDVVALFVEHLPVAIEPEEVCRLLLAPPRTMENFVESKRPPSLADLVENDASGQPLRLIRKGDTAADVVEIEPDGVPPVPQDTVSLGEWFRLAGPLCQPGMAVAALHIGPASTKPLPALAHADEGQVLVPGLRANGNVLHMREVDDDGLHHFVVLSFVGAVPSSYLRTLADKLPIDPVTLSDLIAAYLRVPKRLRSVHAIKVRFAPGD